jgi:histidine phosphotransfer protein HptB
METNAVIDTVTLENLQDMMGADFVVELIDTYCEETGALVLQIQQALAACDTVVFGRLAHSIKSSSTSLGALEFSQQARALEMLGKAGDLSSAGPKVEWLISEYPRVKARLEELKNGT